jgi:hypothetical protein
VELAELRRISDRIVAVIDSERSAADELALFAVAGST